MKIVKTAFKGIVIVEPMVFNDDRGYFLENYHKIKYSKVGITVEFVQEEVTRHRTSVLAAAFENHPNRFINKIPVPDDLPAAVWINPPSVENIGA